MRHGQVGLDEQQDGPDYGIMDSNINQHYQERHSPPRVDSAPSNYTMLSSRYGEMNQEKVKIINGHWLQAP